MNKKQKITVYLSLAAVIGVFVYWIASGAEIFTKNKVLVEKTDEIFGTTYKEWQDKFVWGLDYTAVATLLIIIISGALIYLFKNRKEA
ncbi:MAG: hypothetical protein HXY49_10360 [Ignavibacteriaceae bacterium]|nr:hypothetical protein [Ignavibacteriaceae bacterium]